MENASKALLIAAAVLIVILLIAFGMQIFNSSGDTAGQAESVGASTSMQTFNAQFAGYLGANKSATVVRNLLVIVNNSNKANPSHPVNVTTTEGAAAVTGSTTEGFIYAGSASSYTITASYDTAGSGYITAIEIK